MAQSQPAAGQPAREQIVHARLVKGDLAGPDLRHLGRIFIGPNHLPTHLHKSKSSGKTHMPETQHGNAWLIATGLIAQIDLPIF
jgi:hypothetical protein